MLKNISESYNLILIQTVSFLKKKIKNYLNVVIYTKSRFFLNRIYNTCGKHVKQFINLIDKVMFFSGLLLVFNPGLISGFLHVFIPVLISAFLHVFIPF